MSRRLPPLVALRAFEAVARLGGTRRAGDDLNVSHTVISRHLRNLEDWAGVRLTERDGRGIALTPEGRRYFEAIAQGFDLIAAATEELSPKGGAGEMRIFCVPGLAVRWLTRRLSALEAALPGVEIVLQPTDRSPDFARGEADAEIGFNLRGQPGTTLAALLAPRFFPVASPTFVARRGPFAGPADMAAAPLIHEESREQWRQWLALAGLDPVPALHGPRLWHADAAVEAALQGQGIALANALLVGDDLAAGRLVEVLETDISLGTYALRAPQASWGDRNTARLRHWLAAAMAGNAAGGEGG
ncbi:LysR substrate-binding domain-containing protein [Zavarzinia compransoris]|uniref:LysR family transcriptional regulator n=1 Tax=Zavarzinia compransoris TaxID=1264899 RepID=A0A317DYR2_9PROT|nr:LysR substrate-binding domain-containing protein [Zavarzinia compransoris]PWR18005.1 LysR family transcriptional regulator [Zavarzinia compransoris]TDP43531.1 DNA-binding transcriptional LysR family regulator [Zavarzinia compransoris]